MLAALQLDRHAGAVRYFFDETLFTVDFFRHQVEREIANLGERYDPEVHVDVDLGDYLEAVARTPAFAARVAEAVEEAATAARRLVDAGAAPDERENGVDRATATATALAQTLRAGSPRLTEPDDTVVADLVAALDDVSRALDEIDTTTETELNALPVTPARPPAARKGRGIRPTARADDPEAGTRRRLYELRARLARAQDAVVHARTLLTSDAARAAAEAALLFTGPAGCGKSHLVADGARRRVDRGHPTLLLLGQHLVGGNVWPQLLGQLDLALSGRDLLATLSVAARVRGEGRALLIVDAINEGAGADLWRDQLAGFLADCAAYPWVAVVLTVRDTYRREVLPPAELRVTEVIHRGLAGHEEEALHRYAAHYGLRLPDFPPMLPELTNPLFLRSLCRSVRARGHDAIPREAVSLSWVFDGLLTAANAAVSRPQRLDREVSDHIVQRAVTALAEALLDADDEHLPYETARDLCQTIHPEPRASRSLLNAMVAEGLLLRERVSHGAQAEPSDRIRVTYQRMADHVRAETLLARHPENVDLRSAVLDLCADGVPWRRRGLLEALVLLTGERRDVELAVLLELDPSHDAATDDQRLLSNLLADAFFATLVWRDPATLDDAALELLQGYLDARAIDATQWLALLLTVACVPGHPLNVHRLDRALRGMRLAERDLLWSRDVLFIADEEGNPVSRTIDWAWSCPSTVGADVVELTATLLFWLLTSPNRRIRDTATKALLHLTSDHPMALTRLIRGLDGVDAPYVVERVIAVACGHAVRHAHDRLDTEARGGLLELGRAVFDIVFGTAVPTHLLTRHYARTAVEVIDATLRGHGETLDRDLTAARPPYSSPWPLVAPLHRALATAYERRPSRYLTAVSEFGMDFEEKTIRHLVDDFVLPGQGRLQAARRAGLTRRRNRTFEQLNPGLRQHADLARRVDALLGEADARRQIRGWQELIPLAPKELRPQLEDLERLARQAAGARDKPVRPDADLVGRWIARRVLELGWNRQEFGTIDRNLAEVGSRRAAEVERYAEKYAWIAFFEVAGHLADHCTVQQFWSDTPVAYDGPWQLGYVEDLDPTSTLRGDQPPDDSAAGRLRAQQLSTVRRAAWWLAGDHHELHVGGADEDWLRDTTDMPDPMSLASVTDGHGDAWTVLEFATTWRVPMQPGAPGSSWQQDRRQLPVHLKSMLVPASQVDLVLGWAARQRWDTVREPESVHPHAPFLKGYPDIERWPRLLQQVFDEYRTPGGWTTLDVGGSTVEVAPATVSCANRADKDFSNRDYGAVLLPAPQLCTALRAGWCAAPGPDADRLRLGAYEAEHAWCADGQVVTFASDTPSCRGTAGIFIRRGALHAALAAMDAALVTTIYAEKIFLRGHDPSHDRGELHAVIAHTAMGPRVFSVAHVAQVWRGNERVEEPIG
ncbi:hypothetical protein DQ238_09650 [Geodermatophilus sp. TF02-6]|uniref:hypothetical protein n=1 Tax=Geodermatophilus sp. TF02-6 TaxID=2250575 RepID=UPI000DE9EC29|nr:hypothetical protein [Geodermatophilus sp. TF02-6]RBY79880.1 hypothetical protein DQ238_09650 [Geodermatophilus sp. TF02-6]